MPSPVGHFIGGVAAGWLVAGAPEARPVRQRMTDPTIWREAMIFGALGVLPDFDLLLRDASNRDTQCRGSVHGRCARSRRVVASTGDREGLRHRSLAVRPCVCGCLSLPHIARLARSGYLCAVRRHGPLAVLHDLLRIGMASLSGDFSTLPPGMDIHRAECPRGWPRSCDPRANFAAGDRFPAPPSSRCAERR